MAEATVYGSTALWTRLSHSVARFQSPRPVEVDLMGGVVRDLLVASLVPRRRRIIHQSPHRAFDPRRPLPHFCAPSECVRALGHIAG